MEHVSRESGWCKKTDTNPILVFVEPFHEREDVSSQACQAAEEHERLSYGRVASEAIIYHSGDAGADQPREVVSVFNALGSSVMYSPSDANVIYASAKVHARAMGTSGHGVPYRTAEETEEGERHEKHLGCVGEFSGVNEGDEVESPEQEGD